MGTTLTGKRIKDTYLGFIKTTDNSAVDATGKQLSDALDKVRNMGLKDEDANDMVINILLEMTSKDKALGGAIQKIKKKRKKKRLGGKITYNY